MDNLLHYNEIARAVRLLCQSTVALTEDTDGTNQVTVGSNRLFSVGNDVELLDDDTTAEQYEVTALVGLTGVQLDSVISGEFTVANNAMIRLAEPLLPELTWGGQGRPLLMPQPPELQLPGIVVEPAVLDQPMTEGTNRSVRQDYHYRVYYLLQPAASQYGNQVLLDQAGKLFSLLMRDIYLGGSCWYAQVTRVDPASAVQRHFADRGIELSVVEMELIVRRLEPIW